MKSKKSGILLHISSLPSSFGIGDFGPSAFEFVDFLNSSNQSFWQILPLNPTESFCGHSPYSSPSAFAMNTLFISPEVLLKEGLLTKEDLGNCPQFAKDHVEFDRVAQYKGELLRVAYNRFLETNWQFKDFQQFVKKHHIWLHDYALFVVAKHKWPNQSWLHWPDGIRNRNKKELEEFALNYAKEIEEVKFYQYVCFYQWAQLREYCREKKVKIIGDIPIYVSLDSVDVWSHHQLFKLNENKEPIFVAGVPPDYFSETGQRWGNPVYDWDRLEKEHFQWWIDRIKMNLDLMDMARIDHFRGLVAYWEIPSSEKTAMKGQWVKVPIEKFFTAVKNRLGKISIIAEDLGIITDDVREAMKDLGFPGMKILLFAFNGDMKEHIYLPHNYESNCVVYTGTHDNNTVQGWWEKEATPIEKENFIKYIEKDLTDKNIHWGFIELALGSRANLAIIPLQDVLGFAADARMNIPGSTHGNWAWRYSKEAVTKELSLQLASITEHYSRV